MRAVTLGSTPNPWLPRRASPLNFSSTRLKTGSAILKTAALTHRPFSSRARFGHVLAHFEPCEAPDADVLAKPGDLRSYQVTHRAAAGLILDEVLVVKTVVFEILVHLALHNAVDHI